MEQHSDRRAIGWWKGFIDSLDSDGGQTAVMVALILIMLVLMTLTHKSIVEKVTDTAVGILLGSLIQKFKDAGSNASRAQRLTAPPPTITAVVDQPAAEKEQK